MKLQTLIFTFLLGMTFISCGDNEPGDTPSVPEYTITIHSPNTTEVTAGESVHIHVDFDEPNELTIHHVNIQVVTDSGEMLYNGPSTAHVHVDGGHHEHHDDVVIDVATGTEITVTAKVWGHVEGLAEKSTSTSFMVQ